MASNAAEALRIAETARDIFAARRWVRARHFAFGNEQARQRFYNRPDRTKPPPLADVTGCCLEGAVLLAIAEVGAVHDGTVDSPGGRVIAAATNAIEEQWRNVDDELTTFNDFKARHRGDVERVLARTVDILAAKVP